MILIKRLTVISILTALAAATAPLSAADLFPGHGSAIGPEISGLQYGMALSLPLDGATDVSQSPTLMAVALAAPLVGGTTVQYHFQLDPLPTLDSQGGNPLGDFNQVAAQSFAAWGAFTGQDARVTGAYDAYNSTNTASFVFYSTSSLKLSANTQYYWRARIKPATGPYSAWSGTASFTTGRLASQSPINHLAVSGVNLYGATAGGLASISFTIAENNVTTGTSTNLGAYNTADWIFVKFSTMSGVEGSWNHATLTSGNVDAGAALTAASDYKGVFINHTVNSAYWTAGATVTWNFAADGVDGKTAIVNVLALSMVRVPTGSFVYNVGGVGGNTPANYGGGSQVTVTSAANIPTGAAAGWPNGYNSFYIGRYEITAGQYSEFLNTISVSQAVARFASGWDITYAAGNAYGSRYAASNINRVKSVLSVSDAWSYMSWAGLRPPTEMEFEKAGRDLAADARVYPWGNTVPNTVTYTPPNEGGPCIRRYLNYNNTTGCAKVLDAGRYMSGDVYRTAAETGASPWGIADLAGNAFEWNLNCSYLSVPANGNGTVSWPSNWPTPGTSGFGMRGGSWYSVAANIRLSDRLDAGRVDPVRGSDFGARVARGQ